MLCHCPFALKTFSALSTRLLVNHKFPSLSKMTLLTRISFGLLATSILCKPLGAVFNGVNNFVGTSFSTFNKPEKKEEM